MSGFIEGSIAEAFPPRPGGLVDSARQPDPNPVITPPSVVTDPTPYPAVRVRVEAPDLATARTITLGANNPVLRLLPRDAQRRSAVILAVDNDVYLSNNEGAARDAEGSKTSEGAFYLLQGLGIPLDTQGEIWVSATTVATTSRVSVFVSLDSRA